MHYKLPAHVIRRIAVVAGCDPRTVAKVLAGLRVLPAVRERIEIALTQEPGAPLTVPPAPPEIDGGRK